jgi:hypothetical protein
MSNSPAMPIRSRPADATLDIRPVTPAIGAEIHGVPLSGDLPFSGSHQGRRPKRPHSQDSQAGYMTAPERWCV